MCGITLITAGASGQVVHLAPILDQIRLNVLGAGEYPIYLHSLLLKCSHCVDSCVSGWSACEGGGTVQGSSSVGHSMESIQVRILSWH